jgi:thioredoxin 1
MKPFSYDYQDSEVIKMLDTGLPHIETNELYKQAIHNHENVMLCCGRMGPMCIPVYDIMEELVSRYPNIYFCDMDFDGPASDMIRKLPEVQLFMGLPFTIYYHRGEVVAATTSIQTEEEITAILDLKFKVAE